MVTTPLYTGIFSDRSTLSGHDNQVNNLADEQGSVLAANIKPVKQLNSFEEQESHSKRTLFFTTHSRPRTHRTVLKTVATITFLCQGHQTVGPKLCSNSSSGF